MITIKQKDELLAYMMEHIRYPRTYINFNDTLQSLNMGIETVVPILRQMERMGILTKLQLCNFDASFLYDTVLDEFSGRGGFAAQETFICEKVEKLKLEIKELEKELEPPLLERAKTLTDLAVGISKLLFIIG